MVALAALTLSSCKDFLDVQPEGSPSVPTYFSNDDQAINAMKSIYAPSQYCDDLFGREIYWEQLAANAMVAGRTKDVSGTLFTFRWTGDEGPLTTCYKNLNLIIARCNWVVSSLLKKQKQTELTAIETRTLGEAYFMRGFLHLTLAYRYGCKTQGAPFIKYEDFEGDYDYSIPPQLPTVMDNFAIVVDDFKQAEIYLPRFETYGPDDRGRAHKAAAVALMARAYAYWATFEDGSKAAELWNNVIACVNSLENNYGRALAPSFTKLFSVDFNDFWTSEYCFSFPSNGGSRPKCGGIEWTGVIMDKNGWGGYGGWGQFKPSLDIYLEFQKDGKAIDADGKPIKDAYGKLVNERLATSILEYGQEFQYYGMTKKYYDAGDIPSGFQINKWMQPFESADPIGDEYVNSNTDYPCCRVNFHVIRFAECLLLRAEANLWLGNQAAAAKDMNAVRARVNLPECAGTWTDLYHERMCELAFEPTVDHAYDIKRWAVYGPAEIKNLAVAEITKHPDARTPDDKTNPASTYKDGPYPDYLIEKEWADYKICFPYPSTEITNSAGTYKQNPGY